MCGSLSTPPGPYPYAMVRTFPAVDSFLSIVERWRMPSHTDQRLLLCFRRCCLELGFYHGDLPMSRALASDGAHSTAEATSLCQLALFARLSVYGCAPPPTPLNGGSARKPPSCQEAWVVVTTTQHPLLQAYAYSSLPLGQLPCW